MARVLIAGGGTGGHLYPALNLAEALRRVRPETEVLYAGARRGLEARVLPGRPDAAEWRPSSGARRGSSEAGRKSSGRSLSYRLLPMQPFHRARAWRNWRLLATAPAVAWGVARIYRRFDPDLVVGTGGYASAPVLVGAGIAGKRMALQEQNAHPGLVTRLWARKADQLHLGFPEAAGRLRAGPRAEVFSYGNPVALPREYPPTGEGAASGAGARARRGFGWPEGRILLVAGGSQGARGLNRHVADDLEAAEAWPADLSVVWVAGPRHAEELSERFAGHTWSDRIRVVPYIDELGRQLARVSLAISRAGAMFVAELAAAGVPAVLVPFPGATDAHQSANADAMAEAGAAVTRREEELVPGELWKLATEILADEERRERMAGAARARGAPAAATRIAGELLRLAEIGVRAGRSDEEREGGRDDRRHRGGDDEDAGPKEGDPSGGSRSPGRGGGGDEP